ncbi:hypothetical protein Elgi_37300 [Paenibacillus elgii]|nr:hypothetical protein Elgi_37300 [Paenibacillus elgii]
MTLTSWRLFLFSATCLIYGIIDVLYILTRGCYEALGAIMYTPVFILIALIACVGLEETKKSK